MQTGHEQKERPTGRSGRAPGGGSEGAEGARAMKRRSLAGCMCCDWLGAQSCAKSAATEGVGTLSADQGPSVSLLLGGCGSPLAGLLSWRTGARWPPRWPLPTTTSTSSAGPSPLCCTTVSEPLVIFCLNVQFCLYYSSMHNKRVLL